MNALLFRSGAAALLASLALAALPLASARGDWLSAGAEQRALPSLDGASAWINSPPLDAKALRGKVVLVDF